MIPKCEKCKELSTINYLGKYLCDKHWNKAYDKRMLGTTKKSEYETQYTLK